MKQIRSHRVIVLVFVMARLRYSKCSSFWEGAAGEPASNAACDLGHQQLRFRDALLTRDNGRILESEPGGGEAAGIPTKKAVRRGRD
jgi:hypothetical protein